MNTPEKSRREYRSRINRVMDYIEKNIEKDINLQILAQKAYFSLYHFHRIFSALTGETPNSFLQRIRIEKSAQMLQDYSDLSISEIAYKCGFPNISSFSRAFRKYFGITAKEFRVLDKAIFVKNGVHYSKMGKPLSKNCKQFSGNEFQLCSVELNKLIIRYRRLDRPRI